MTKLRKALSKPHMQPYIRMSWIIVAVAAVDCAVALILPKPLPWVAIVPAAIPLLVGVLVLPVLNKTRS
jgi:hypothetical protein